jgi:hypothetical protein
MYYTILTHLTIPTRFMRQLVYVCQPFATNYIATTL